MKRNIIRTSILSFVVFLLLSVNAFANKTSVKITAPEKAKIGSEITVKINISHMGNTPAHYTDWVIVKINGKEYKKWIYTKSKLPNSQNFSLEFKIKVKKQIEIEVKGNCNKHGSKGTKKATIKVE